jgi:hypothetical protein
MNLSNTGGPRFGEAFRLNVQRLGRKPTKWQASFGKSSAPSMLFIALAKVGLNSSIVHYEATEPHGEPALKGDYILLDGHRAKSWSDYRVLRERVEDYAVELFNAPVEQIGNAPTPEAVLDAGLREILKEARPKNEADALPTASLQYGWTRGKLKIQGVEAAVAMIKQALGR